MTNKIQDPIKNENWIKAHPDSRNRDSEGRYANEHDFFTGKKFKVVRGKEEKIIGVFDSKNLFHDFEDFYMEHKGDYRFKFPPNMKDDIAQIERKIQENKNQEEKKLLEQKETKKMADENITKFDVLKQKVEDFKEDTKNKLTEREKIDKELEQKVKALDDKVCHGEDCYNRIEKQGNENFKTLEDRLKKLEEPVYVCSNCGIGTMRRGQQQCPYCGVKVKSWA